MNTLCRVLLSFSDLRGRHIDRRQPFQKSWNIRQICKCVYVCVCVITPSMTAALWRRPMQESQRYRMSKKTAQPPHIFAVADSAYQALLGLGGRPPGSQCILIRSVTPTPSRQCILIRSLPHRPPPPPPPPTHTHIHLRQLVHPHQISNHSRNNGDGNDEKNNDRKNKRSTGCEAQSGILAG